MKEYVMQGCVMPMMSDGERVVTPAWVWSKVPFRKELAANLFST